MEACSRMHEGLVNVYIYTHTCVEKLHTRTWTYIQAI